MLNKIIEYKRVEAEREKQLYPFTKLMGAVNKGNFALSQTLKATDWSLIAECKLASPVKGRLSSLSVDQLAKVYSENGATALSVLTDRHFDGSLSHIEKVRNNSILPLLRKDFIVDEYQIYQARFVGADAILLIAAILSDKQLNSFLATAKELGLDCLTEVHSRDELERVQQTEAGIIGINNRDLTTFRTNIEQTFALLPFCDFKRVIVSESGITTRADALRLKRAGVSGVLVGEGLVTAADIAGKVRDLSL